MTNTQIASKVKAATNEALVSRTAYTIVGFTSYGLVVWAADGSCSIK